MRYIAMRSRDTDQIVRTAIAYLNIRPGSLAAGVV